MTSKNYNNLGDDVTSLAKTIQELMASLYDLQSALIRKVPEQNDAMLSSFKAGRREFHSHCERIVTFLQSSQAISSHYIALLGYMKTEPKDEYVLYAKSVETELQRLQAGLTSIKETHGHIRTTLLRKRKDMAKMLQINEKRKSTQKRRGAVGNVNIDPDAAFHDTFNALDLITKNLDAISQFWDRFSKEELGPIANASGNKTFKVNKLYNDESIQRWNHCVTTLRSAVSIISEASDAGLVEPMPVLTPHDNMPRDKKLLEGPSTWSTSDINAGTVARNDKFVAAQRTAVSATAETSNTDLLATPQPRASIDHIGGRQRDDNLHEGPGSSSASGIRTGTKPNGLSNIYSVVRQVQDFGKSTTSMKSYGQFAGATSGRQVGVGCETQGDRRTPPTGGMENTPGGGGPDQSGKKKMKFWSFLKVMPFMKHKASSI